MELCCCVCVDVLPVWYGHPAHGHTTTTVCHSCATMLRTKSSRLSSALGHQKQKLLQRLGQADKTPDSNFQELRAAWEKTLRLATAGNPPTRRPAHGTTTVEKDLKKARKMDSTTRHNSPLTPVAFCAPLAALGDALVTFFDDDPAQAATGYGQAYKAAVAEVEQAVQDYLVSHCRICRSAHSGCSNTTARCNKW